MMISFLIFLIIATCQISKQHDLNLQVRYQYEYIINDYNTNWPCFYKGTAAY